jgi:hypothetical protein
MLVFWLIVSASPRRCLSLLFRHLSCFASLSSLIARRLCRFSLVTSDGVTESDGVMSVTVRNATVLVATTVFVVGCMVSGLWLVVMSQRSFFRPTNCHISHTDN